MMNQKINKVNIISISKSRFYLYIYLFFYKCLLTHQLRVYIIYFKEDLKVMQLFSRFHFQVHVKYVPCFLLLRR